MASPSGFRPGAPARLGLPRSYKSRPAAEDEKQHFRMFNQHASASIVTAPS